MCVAVRVCRQIQQLSVAAPPGRPSGVVGASAGSGVTGAVLADLHGPGIGTEALRHAGFGREAHML